MVHGAHVAWNWEILCTEGEIIMSLQGEKPVPQPNRSAERETVHTPVLSATSARQGATGQNVRYVLAFGMVAIIVAFFIIYLIYFA